ncbi:DUF333 domain-containing protein [Shewanella sp. 3_MG-2023]|uniref:putative hemolysin n=1 Tax=Shewanella sp. 3_MG-2023 TaxID=3062635 RepID=UPI0026E32739|nr:DUF333 domain-containing protein [Shewanella sp. 3_MG-2023]MDO6775735.1 DUF333 domain-containing protein [Shewanella sp. 3_MG-2023]
MSALLQQLRLRIQQLRQITGFTPSSSQGFYCRFRSLQPLCLGCSFTLLSACSGDDITPLHQTNPAADYCLKLDGSLATIAHINGDILLCTLPDGEVVESWELFRRDHQKS